VKWLLLLPLLAIAASAWGANLTSTCGETYLKYSWDEGYEVQIWHNGVYDFNSSLNYYYLPNLKPSERHRLTLYNQSNLTELLGDVTTETAMPSTLLYVLAGVGLVFLILSIIFTPSYFSILDGVFSVLVLAVFSLLIATQNMALMYIAGGAAMIPLLLVVWNLYSIRAQVYM
jgi:hypothetical protein